MILNRKNNMKDIRKVLLASLLMSSISASFAQDNNYDALSRLFSQTAPSGSARFQALGGNHSALGADISSNSSNPAGLGFYTRSEFSISPSFQINSNASSYIDTKKTNANTDNFNIANIGIVFGGQEPRYKDSWRGSWSISYNRQSSLYNKVSFAGRNLQSSLMDSFGEITNRDIKDNGLSLQDFKDGLTNDAPNFYYQSDMYYWSFLINPNGTSSDPFVGAEGGKSVDQRYDFQASGRTSQWTIGYGGTANEKFYIGFSLGLPSFRYETQTDFSENIVNYDAIRSFAFSKYLTTTGQGINLTVGTIIKPTNNFRIGATITTPTWYSIDETTSSTLNVDVDPSKMGGIKLSSDVISGGNMIGSKLVSLGYGINTTGGTSYITRIPKLSTQPVSSNYELRTPFKASGGVAYFFGKKGFLSADVEYVAYKGMQLSTNMNDAYFKGDLDYYTKSIQNTYKNVLNIKVGGEYRMGLFAARGGFAYYQNPYNSNFDNDAVNRAMMVYSAGVGIKTGTFYVDLTGLYGKTQQAYNPYVLNDSSLYATAIIDQSWTRGVLTFGVYF